MMTPQELKTILDADKAFFGPNGDPTLEADGFLPTEVIENLLNGPGINPTRPNPDPAPRTPKPFSLSDLMAAAPSGLTTLDFPTVVEIGNRERAQDREGLGVLFQMLKSEFSADEQSAVSKVLTATIPDSTWPTIVPSLTYLQKANWTGDHSEIAPLIRQALGRPEPEAIAPA